MSYRVNVKTKVNNEGTLLKALENMGFSAEVADEGKTFTTTGHEKAQAHIRLVDANGSHGVSGIGFHRGNDGFYSIVGDFYMAQGPQGKSFNQQGFTNSLNNEYAKSRLADVLAESNFQVTDEAEGKTKGEVIVRATGPNGKEMEAIIKDGEFSLEALNFHGDACEETVREVAAKIGEITSAGHTGDAEPQIPSTGEVGLG